jgi:oxalate---CoA ligase
LSASTNRLHRLKISVDDDQIETMLTIRFQGVADPTPQLQSSEVSPSTSDLELEAETSPTHGVTVEGQIASCKNVSDGLVDCLCCLEIELSKFLIGLAPGDTDLVHHILAAVREEATTGISKDQLMVRVCFLFTVYSAQPIPLSCRPV